MARLESDHGRLLVSFQFNGARCQSISVSTTLATIEEPERAQSTRLSASSKRASSTTRPDFPKAGGLSDSGSAAGSTANAKARRRKA